MPEVKKVEKQEKVDYFNELYKKLSQPIPKEYLVTYTEDGKEFTGYHSQYAIDLLNENVGYGDWGTDENVLKEEIIKNSFLVAMKIIINITVKDLYATGGKRTKLVSGYGASYAKSPSNAYKGAKTSAFKNACRYLGIGKELYVKGFIDEDIIQVEETEDLEGIDPGAKDVLEKINKSENLEQLESLKGNLSKYAQEKAVGKLIYKKFNEKKIKLINK